VEVDEMDDERIALSERFEAPEYARWKELVEATLKGRAAETLRRQTPEGLTLDPIYTDRPAEGDFGGFPGMAPGVRGPDALDRRAAGWDARAVCDAGGAEDVARELADEAARGTRSVLLMAHPGAAYLPTASDLARALEPLDLSAHPVAVDAGGYTPAYLLGLLEAAKSLGFEGIGLTGAAHIDPLAELARYGTLGGSLGSAWDTSAATLEFVGARAPWFQTVGVSALPVHDAGAHAAQEIAFALASLAEALRALHARGVSATDAATRVIAQVGVSGDLFMELSKLRALRLTWAKVLAAWGVPAQGRGVFVHAWTTRTSRTARDPWVNMLRATSECFAAAVGGADAISVTPFDHELGAPSALARRVAANTQSVLELEGHLARVGDPAGGSFYVEHVTDGLARAAWSLFQRIEAGGGLAAALADGWFVAEVAHSAQARAAAVADRRDTLVGVSDFADLDVRPAEGFTPRGESTSRMQRAPGPALTDATGAAQLELAAQAIAASPDVSLAAVGEAFWRGARLEVEPARPWRAAAEWEALRDLADRVTDRQGARPAVFSANIGALRRYNARAQFAARLFTAGGFAIEDSGGFTDTSSIVEAFVASGAQGAVLCGHDDDYAAHAAAFARALTDAGAAFVALAGRPGDDADALRAAGVNPFVHLKCAALDALRGCWSMIGEEAGDE
jgi:methylmalonyl-CoA mutase